MSSEIKRYSTHKEGFGLRFPVDMDDWMIHGQVYFKHDKYIEKLKAAGKPVMIKEKWEHFIDASNLLWGPDCPIHFVWHPWAVDMIKACCSYQYVSFAGSSSCGKCLAIGETVAMYGGGVKRVEDVVVGDVLIGDDGGTRTVLGTHKGEDEMVRITPVTGDPFEATLDHVLTLKRTFAPKKSWRRVGEVKDIRVDEYLKKSQSFQSQHKLFSSGCDYKEQGVEFDPYVYGVWLGDGRLKLPHISFPTSKAVVRDRVLGYFEGLGYHIKKSGDDEAASYLIGSGRNKYKNPFLDFIRGSVGDGSKIIRKEYLLNSREVRLQVLAGLLDADGYLHPNETYFEINVTSNLMSEDVKWLARSLGFRVTAKKKMSRAIKGGEEFEGNRINILGDVYTIPTIMAHKRGRKSSSGRDSTATDFTVERIGKGSWAGFQVDGNGRFLLGDFTVTHNSEFMGGPWANLNFLVDYRHTLVLVTSKSLRESKRRVWAAVKKHWDGLPEGLRGVVGKLTDHPTPCISAIRDGATADNAGIVLILADASQGGTKTSKVQGVKAYRNKQAQSRCLLVGDEFTELSFALVDTMYSNLSNNDEFHAIAAANPLSKIQDPFGPFAKPKIGWGKLHVEMESWETENGGICLHFDALKNPNYLAKENLWPIQKWEAVEAAITESGGTNTQKFWRNCRGFWVPDGMEDAGIYSESEILQDGADTVFDDWEEGVPRKMWAGCDTAFADGGDRCVLMFAEEGKKRNEGKSIINLHSYYELVPDPLETRLSVERQIAKKIVKLCRELGVPPGRLGVDSTGPGRAFCTILDEEFDEVALYRCEFAGSATRRPISDLDSTPANEAYVDKSAELAFYGKELLKHCQLYGLRWGSLTTELTSRKHSTVKSTTGRTVIKLEKKRDLRKRIKKSPDIMDAMNITLDTIRERSEFKGSQIIISNNLKSPEAWKKFVKDNSMTYKANRRLIIDGTTNPAVVGPQAMRRNFVPKPRRLLQY